MRNFLYKNVSNFRTKFRDERTKSFKNIMGIFFFYIEYVSIMIRKNKSFKNIIGNFLYKSLKLSH